MDCENKLTLKELQKAELELLLKFDEFCTSRGLRYTLVGGTLLGAIRHKGFIPWDDDVDVGMPRPDYERFYEIVANNGFVLPSVDNNIMLLQDRGEKMKLPFLKLVNTDYEVRTRDTMGTDNIWIDIMPYDGYPNTLRETRKFCKKMNWYRRLIIYNMCTSKRRKGIMRLVAWFFCIFARKYGKERALKKMYALIEKNDYDKSEFVGAAIWGLYGIGERVEKREFENFVKVEFENNEFFAMACWDKYLTGIYGDYMTLPPEDKRGSHHIVAYRIKSDN